MYELKIPRDNFFLMFGILTMLNVDWLHALHQKMHLLISSLVKKI